MMRSSGVHLGLFAIALTLGSMIDARAGLLYPGGNPHPNAIPGFSGTVPLVHDPGGANQHYGDIEYAVFTAANFAVAFPGEDTPNGGVAASEAVYAYQVINNGARGDITQFSAGLADLGPPLFPTHHGDGFDDNEFVNLGDQDYIAGTGQDPSVSTVIASAFYGAINGSSVRWNFVGNSAADRLNSGETSSVLFYTSPFGPRWDNGSTTTGGGQSRIPAPEERISPFIPEPSSGVLVLMALGLLPLKRCGR